MAPAADVVAAPSTDREFDVCVIGAGAAGLVLAEVLSRTAGLRICLIEAGPDHFKDRVEPYYVRSVLKQHLGVNECRVTAFGGATNTWGGGLIRLSAADFEPIEGRPDTEWPISYASLVPHYEAVESLFGFAAAAEGPKNLLLDRNDLCVRRREIPILLFRNKNFSNRFGPSLRGRSNVSIFCDATIVRFEASKEGRLARIEVNRKGGDPFGIRASRYVVSAGTVNTNLLAERILRDCGVQDATASRGRFFHDHISFPIARLRPKSPVAFSKKFGYLFERGLMIGEHFDIESKGPRAPGAFLHLSLDTADSSILRPVREVLNMIQRRTLKVERGIKFGDILPLLTGLPRLGFMRYIHNRLYLDPGTKVLATLDLEQVPTRDWKLEGGADGTECRLTWDVTEDDANNARRCLPVCREILDKLQSEARFDVEVLIPDPKSDPAGFMAYLKQKSVDTFHSSGGLRMSSAQDALVDADLRLRGVKNVHILSSAVFPRVGTSNSTLTILALGHRLATQITDSHQRATPSSSLATVG